MSPDMLHPLVLHFAWCPPATATVTARSSCSQGFDIAKKALLEFLDTFKTTVDPTDREVRTAAEAAAGTVQACCGGVTAPPTRLSLLHAPTCTCNADAAMRVAHESFHQACAAPS